MSLVARSFAAPRSRSRYKPHVSHFVAAMAIVSAALAQSNDAATALDEGRAALSARRYNEAVQLLSITIEKDPQSEQAWLLRGIANRHLGRLQAALADESKAVDLMPSDAHALTNRATVENDLGRYDRAESDASEALHLQPELASAYTARGAARVQRRDYGEGERDLTKAIELDARQPDAWLLRAQAREGRQRSKEAWSDFVKFAEISDARYGDPGWKHVILDPAHKNVSRWVSGADPRFPRLSRGVERRVVVVFVIATTGHVRRVVPVMGDPGLIEPAVDALRNWRFTPPLENGEPVEAIGTFAFAVHGG